MSATKADDLPRPSRRDSSDSVLEHELVRLLRTGRAALPVLPAVAESALRLANDPGASVSQLACLVDTDPPIAARFMSVANLVPHWRGKLASSTQMAIMRLGLSSTRDLLFQAVYATTSIGVKRFQVPVQRSFQRSVETAVAAGTAARELGIASPLDYMSGLLHDIGESRVYRILDGLSGAGHDPAEVARLVQKYHCAAGAELAMAWNLPTEIVDACAAHHDPVSRSSEIVRLVMIADAVIDAIDTPTHGESLNPDNFADLGVSADAARSIVAQTRVGIGVESREARRDREPIDSERTAR